MNRRITPLQAVLLIVVIGGTTMSIWIPQQQKLSRARLALEMARTQRGDLDHRISAATTVLENSQRELNDWREKNLTTKVAAKHIEEDLAEPVVNDRWTEAPTTFPDWNAQSPYVWLKKDLFRNVAARPFTRGGELRRETAILLSLTENQRLKLNNAIQGLLAAYHDVELAHTERGVAPPRREGESPRITLRTDSILEEAGRFKNQFGEILAGELGDQRMRFLMILARDWIMTEFRDFGNGSRTISANRRADGTYEVAIDSNSPTMSGMMTLDETVPHHLLPFFDDLKQFKPPHAK